jgi:DDE family transposase
MPSSPIPAARCHCLPGLLAQVPDPRVRRGRRHPLAGLLAVGIAAVIAGSRSFAAIGQRAADAGPEALAVLGTARGPAEESTFRRASALVSADILDRVLGAWLWTRAVQADGPLVIAIDGKTVRGARNKTGKAPHLVAALAHGIGTVLGQVAVDEKSNEIPAVRELLKAFTDLAGQDGKCASCNGVTAQSGHQPPAPGRPHQHRRRGRAVMRHDGPVAEDLDEQQARALVQQYLDIADIRGGDAWVITGVEEAGWGGWSTGRAGVRPRGAVVPLICMQAAARTWWTGVPEGWPCAGPLTLSSITWTRGDAVSGPMSPRPRAGTRCRGRGSTCGHGRVTLTRRHG